MNVRRLEHSPAPYDLPPGSDVDKQLTLAFQRGERGAYGVIHERYGGRISHICRRMLGNPDDAQEAAQEANLRVYQALGKFNGRYQLGAWIARITTNVCLDALRARNRNPVDATVIEMLEQDSPVPEDVTDPELLYLRHAESKRVHKVLASLPPLHRAAIVLREFEGMSYAEIAGILEMTECQVKALLHRARKSFRRSWTSALASAFFPIRQLLDRLRGVGDVARDEIVRASSTSPGLLSAGAERVSAVAMAVVLTGGVGAAIVHRAPATEAEVPAAQPAESSDEMLEALAPEVEGTVVNRPAETEDRTDDAGTPVLADAGEAPDATAPAEAAPDPEAPPAEEPTDNTKAPEGGSDGGETPPPGPSPSLPPSPPAEPAGFGLSFRWEGDAEARPCSCGAPTTVTSEHVFSNGGEVTGFDQAATGSATDRGGHVFGLRYRQTSWDMIHYTADFVFETGGGTYSYRAKAGRVSVTPTAWGGFDYRYVGSYELMAYATAGERVPRSGRIEIVISVSPRSGRITSTSFFLTESGV